MRGADITDTTRGAKPSGRPMAGEGVDLAGRRGTGAPLQLNSEPLSAKTQAQANQGTPGAGSDARLSAPILFAPAHAAGATR